MEDFYYKAEEVRAAARTNWLYILDALAPTLSPAIQKKMKGKGHSPCPVHGGKDGFRLFDDAHITGGGICNTCGAHSDGFEILMWVNDIDFTAALMDVGEYLQCTRYKKRKSKSQPKKSPVKDALERHGKLPANKPDSNNINQTGSSSASDKVVPIARDVRPELKAVQKEMDRRLERQKQYSAQKAVKIKRIWESSVSPLSPAAEPMKKYFSLRKLSYKNLSESSVRFHSNLEYHDEEGKLVGSFPAIVCAIKNRVGQIVTLHRTYLTSTGKKARVKSPKKMMPIPDGLRVNGGAIQLGDPVDGVLGIAEGLETCQSALRASGYPCWCTVNATLLEMFEPPEGVHTILIWADKDRSLTGELKSHLLKEKLDEKGINVITLIPPIPLPANNTRVKGIDWNDVILGQGLLGFPSRRQLERQIAQLRPAYAIEPETTKSDGADSTDDVTVLQRPEEKKEVAEQTDDGGDVIDLTKRAVNYR